MYPRPMAFTCAAPFAGAVKSLHLKADITLRPGRWAWRWPRTRGSRVCSRLGLPRAAAATAWAVPTAGRAHRRLAGSPRLCARARRPHAMLAPGCTRDRSHSLSLSSSCARVPSSVRVERILPCAPVYAAHFPPHTFTFICDWRPPQRVPRCGVLWRTARRCVQGLTFRVGARLCDCVWVF